MFLQLNIDSYEIYCTSAYKNKYFIFNQPHCMLIVFPDLSLFCHLSIFSNVHHIKPGNKCKLPKWHTFPGSVSACYRHFPIIYVYIYVLVKNSVYSICFRMVEFIANRIILGFSSFSGPSLDTLHPHVDTAAEKMHRAQG